MTTTKFLSKKTEVIRNLYHNVSCSTATVEDLDIDDRELFESMERFHKLSHTRWVNFEFSHR